MATPRLTSAGPAHEAHVASYRRALSVAAAAVEDVRPADWARPTPCDAWDVRAVVNHLIAGNLASARAVVTGTADGADYARDNTGDDPAAAFATSARVCAAAWTDDVPLDRVLVMPYGAFPAGSVVGVSLLELLVHTWDIGRARSVEPRLDAALCEKALRFAQRLPAELRLGGSPPYRPPVAAVTSASPGDRLAAFLGRDPAWTPGAPARCAQDGPHGDPERQASE